MNPFVGTSRGGFAPRRGRGYGGRFPHYSKPREQVKPDITKHPLGDLIKTIRASDIAGTKQTVDTAEILACHHVSSYNWTDDASPTIIVPGKPPRWTPLGAPQRLKEDSGQYFRDLNAANYPSYPMAPVVHAVLEEDPEYPTADIDLFACGSTLGNLLRFARGIDKAFRFNVEVIGNTVFFVRKENDPKELIEGVRGFGHTFPEAYTTWDNLKNSVSHQRIIRYEFGGLDCLVRFESDGYINDSSTTKDADAASTKHTHDDENDDIDIVQALKGISVNKSSGKPSSSAAPTTTTLTVQKGGSAVPHTSIFDLKTRSGRYKKDIDMSDIYPQLWLKQIPNFITAYHDGAGLFNDIRVQNVTSDVQAWAQENADGIHRFAALVNMVLQAAKDNETSLLEVYCPGADRLEIRMQHGDGARTLPLPLSERWAEDARDKELWRADSPVHGGVRLNHVDDEEAFGLDRRYNLGYDSDDDDDDDSGTEPDYTACSADDCGYCGKCSY